MHRYVMAGLLICAAAPAMAQEPAMAPPTVQAPAFPKWVATAGASVTLQKGAGSEPSVNASLTHLYKNGYLGLSVSISKMSNTPETAALLPQRIEIATLSGGRNIGRFLVEGHISGGQGIFGNRPPAPSGVVFDSMADGLGVGGSVSTRIKVASNLVLIPRIGLDYATTRMVNRTASPTSGSNLLEFKSDGFTWSTGGDMEFRFGSGRRHGVLISVAAMRTSNVADFIHRNTRVDINQKADDVDVFANLAATVSFGLSPKVALALGASQSGFTAGAETTVLSTTLRLAF